MANPNYRVSLSKLDDLDLQRSNTNYSFRLRFLLAVGTLAGIAATIGYFAAANAPTVASTKLAATAVATTATASVASPLFAALVIFATVALIAAALSSRRTVHVGSPAPVVVVEHQRPWYTHHIANRGSFFPQVNRPYGIIPAVNPTNHGHTAAGHRHPASSIAHNHGMFAPTTHHGHSGAGHAASAPPAFDARSHGNTHSRR